MVALPQCRAASLVKGGIVLLEEGRVSEAGAEPAVAVSARTDRWAPRALFAHCGGVALLGRAGLVLWPEIPGEAKWLPIAEPLASDHAGRHRDPLRAVSAGGSSAWVLLTKHASAVESDAWIRLEWDEERAFWNGAPRALAWSDIPKQPVGLAATAVPYLQSLMALRDGRLRLYHTSTEVGSLGNARGGWAWSLLVTLSDVEQPVGIDEVIGGYGHAASDGSVFLIKAGRGNKLHVYDAHPRELGALPLTPKLIGAKTWRQSFDVDADDLWLSTSDGVSHVKLSGLDRAGAA